MPVKARKKKQPARIEASMFYKYDACPHWLYFDVHADPRKKQKLSRFADMLLQMGIKHEKDVIGDLMCVQVKGRGTAARARATLALMKQGVDCIYHGVLMSDEFVGEPDILEKRLDRSSDLGAYYYVAVDIKSGERLTDAHKYQLVCYGELLRSVQGIRPEEGCILNGARVRVCFPLREFELQFHKAAEDIRALFAGEVPPPHLSSSCKQSPWFEQCKALAKKTDDIALLYNVKKKAVQALRDAGVRSVAQAERMDIDALVDPSTPLKRGLLERVALQARALREGVHFVRRRFEVPEAPCEIFFDIEGDPLRQVEYLLGFLVRRGSDEKFIPILAERPEQERDMWAEFLEWLETLPEEYMVYHYGTYEKTRLTILESRYGGSGKLEHFRGRMVDLNEIVKEHIVFPLYFYGIKDIGSYINVARSKKIAGGGESVAFYEEWLEKGDRRKLDAIIEYNKDDVIATRHLKDWLSHEKERVHEEL